MREVEIDGMLPLELPPDFADYEHWFGEAEAGPFPTHIAICEVARG